MPNFLLEPGIAIYMALAVSKILPKIYLSDFVNRRDRRRHNRSIHPSPSDPRP